MLFSIKNKLVIAIFISLLAGIITGYIINNYYTDTENILSQKYAHDSFIKLSIQKDIENIKHQSASNFSILSEIFLRLIKMIIAPLVLSILISGIGKIENITTIGRIGIKTLLYFYLMTFVALLLGLLSVNIFEPGYKMNIPIPSNASNNNISNKSFDAHEFITHIIPDSIFNVLSKNEILPVVIFSIIFGISAHHSSKKNLIFDFSEAVSETMFRFTHYVMYFAPLGIFGSITAIIIKQGLDVLKGYLYFILIFYLSLLFFVTVVLYIVCKIYKINYFQLLKLLYEPIILAFSTASSEAAMPSTIEALKKFGLSEKIIGFVLPLGYSFNLDGSIIYMTFATVFIAQSYHISLSIPDQINMMLILMLSSKGIAGVPRASLVVIAGTLVYFNIPAEGLLLLLAIDQILDMGRSAVNVLGNAVATAVIEQTETTHPS